MTYSILDWKIIFFFWKSKHEILINPRKLEEKSAKPSTLTSVFCKHCHKMADNGNKNVCCCCWEQFSAKSKSLLPVNSTVEDLMKLFIYLGYSREVVNFSKTICNTCQRNLYRLMKEEGNRGAWNEKISKVRYYLFSGHLFQSHSLHINYDSSLPLLYVCILNRKG